LKPLVLEAGAAIGHAARQWGHVRMFSPWEYNIDRAAERLLVASGWNSPDPHQYPTGAELVERYLEPLATRTPLKDHIQTSSRVTAISRVGFDKVKTVGRELARFELRYENGTGAKTVRADAVIDASGSWSMPAPQGRTALQPSARAKCRIALRMRCQTFWLGAKPLRWQNRCGLGQRSFGGRHLDRPCAPQEGSTRNPGRVALAGRETGKSVRRR
jgi:hypothetical protein